MRCCRNTKALTLVLAGFLVHALILNAAFDIYFSSPIDSGMNPIKSTNNPPAKRLVFIVADGLRAEAIFENENNLTEIAPNLEFIKRNRGSWGISHTRVPTESRPGHVALLGGIFEDPAAILKGWSANPVDFDSVINQSTNAWCWGGPSIVNMFNRDNSPHIHLHSYDPKMEDFGNNNTIGLDLWVFIEVEDFVWDQGNPFCTECKKFNQSGNLFFLHLLGTDTAGHAFKPGSDGYRGNIKFVDENIPKIEQLFEEAFPDHSTAYIFTADHGMTNWGSHGSGSPHETETPLITWGAGIKVQDVQKDVKQVDIAPLISALIGINYPINNLGRLPISYIEASIETLSEMLLSNVLQLAETFVIKRNRRMKNAISFVPFRGFPIEHLDEALINVRNLKTEGDFVNFINASEELMTFLINGSNYYHNYYQVPLLTAITIGLIAWIVFVATFNVVPRGVPTFETEGSSMYLKHTKSIIFATMYLNVLGLVTLQVLPVMYYFYFLFPVVMVHIVVNRYRHIIDALKSIKGFGFANTVEHFLVYLIGIKFLVYTFKNREALTIVMYLLGLFVYWQDPLKTHTTKFDKTCWSTFCILLSVFPCATVMKTTFEIYSYIGGYILWAVIFKRWIIGNMEKDPSNIYITLQMLMFGLTPIYTLAVEFGYVASDSDLKYAAFVWAFVPMLLIPATSTRIFTRITSIVMGFGTYYLMVSTTYEVLFLAIYALLLYSWMKIESRCFRYTTLVKKTFTREVRENYRQTGDDIRRAFIFITLVFIGFFGTGNIASLNSFDPMWVRCFLTVFSPFKMSGLILLKISIPFIFVSSVYRAINLFRRGRSLQMFCIVLTFSDLMVLELLYYIDNIGSWLEIGMSLSHFIIMEAFVLILIVLYGVGYLLTNSTYPVMFLGGN